MQLCHPTAAPVGFGFQLPTLNAEIPNQAVLVTTDIPDVDLIRTLIDINIIDPNELRSSITTPTEILVEGMTAWLDHHLGEPERMNFRCGFYPAHNANAFVESMTEAMGRAGYDTEDEDLGFPNYSRPVFYLSQSNPEQVYFFEHAAKILEEHQPGLFAAVMFEIEMSAAATLPVRTAESLLNQFCMDWYGGYDLSDANNPKNLQSIKAELRTRLEPRESLKGLLPADAKDAAGYNYWFQPQQRMMYTTPVLKKIAKTTKNRLVKSVCTELAKLREKREIAKKKNAFLPNMGDFPYCDPVFSACCLQYKKDDMMKRTLDDFLEHHTSDSECNADYYGLQELPDNPKKLSEMFTKLEIAFAVLGQMDALITLITPSH